MNTETGENLTMEETDGMETRVTETEAAGGVDQGGTGAAGSLPGKAASDSAGADGSGATKDRTAAGEGDGAAELRAALTRAEERVTQLERERALLSQGVAEEDLDYYVFKIGKLMTGGKDFDTAAKEFLKQNGAARRASAPRSTGASLSGRVSVPRSTNDTMNRILRGI